MFYYKLIPSLFESESSNWPSKLTGYHISNYKISSKGSQNLKIDLSINVRLKVLIILYKSSTGLHTQRILKQSYLIFISGIIGSVFGIMNLVVFFMGLIEGLYTKFLERSAKINVFEKIKAQSKVINRINFGMQNKKEGFGRKVIPLEEDESMIKYFRLGNKFS